jgi:serine/threonine protein kinase
MEPLQPGDLSKVGSYQLLGRLGAGGMGQVFLGRSPGGRPVAVKLIRPEHAGNSQFRSRFAREVEAAKRVGGFHTALVLDADPDADPPWMVTAFIPGPSLRDTVIEHGPLMVSAVRALGAGLAEGLAAIHACGLAHRDLKPGNVILAPDGPRIIDFGLARTVDASAMTETGAVLGTYAYMSPEQVRGEPASPASDVFALGCVLTFAATGHSPFDAGSIATIVHRLTCEEPDLREMPQDLGLRSLIGACLAKNSADRPGIDPIITHLSEPGAGSAWFPSFTAIRTASLTSAPNDARGSTADESGATIPPADSEVFPQPTHQAPAIPGQARLPNAVLGKPNAGGRSFLKGAIELDEAAAQLAMAVGAQWREEEEGRRLHDPFPLPVHWHPAAPALVDHWANIRRAPAGANSGPLLMKGRLERIADVYRQIPSGRLAVLGRAGAGKTIVALRFVLDMITTRRDTDPIPVLLRVGAWNPKAASIRSWVTHQLESEYPALAARSLAGTSLAAALVGADRILPVLDGFDEIADGLHGAALRGLNATTMPLLLTSRLDEYVAAVTNTSVMSGAAGVELDDLSLADLTDYLPRTTRPARPDGQLTTVWDPVLTHLRDQPGDPASEKLRHVLSTPLMVTLARAVYSDTPGRNPSELLDREKFDTVVALEDRLLDAFTPDAYQDPPGDYPGGRHQQWNPSQAQRWLGNMARQLDRLGTNDLAVWRLGTTTSRFTRGLTAGAGNFLVFGLAGWLAGGGAATGSSYARAYALINGLVFGLAGGLSAALGARKEPLHAQIRFRGAASRYIRRLSEGFAVGAAFALTVGLGIGGALLSGLACGLALGSHVWLHRPTLITTVPSPREALRQDRTATLAFGLATAVAFGTVGGLTVGYSGDPAVTIPSAFANIAVTALLGLAAGALLGGLSYGRVGAISYGLAVTIAGGLADGPAYVTGIGPGLSYGLAFGCAVAAITMLPRAWGTYTVNRICLALRGQLPWRLMAFLTDAHRRGVLRQSGGVYQFRHARLQHQLAGSIKSRDPRQRVHGMPPGLGRLRLSCHAGILRYLAGSANWSNVRPPARHRYQSGFDQFQVIEESGDLLDAADMVRIGHVFVVARDGLRASFADVDTVGDGEIAAGRHSIHQALDDRLWAVGVRDLPEDPQHHERDGLGEVQRLGRFCQDLVGVAHVGVDVVAGTLWGAGQQGAGVH